MRLVVALGLLAACHKPSPNCERAVSHVLALVASGPPGSEPHAGEQAVIDQVRKQALDACDREGLSDAARDCIVRATSLTDRAFLTCPALVARPPSWIIAPIGHPEALDEVEQLRQQVPPVEEDKLRDDREHQP